MYKRRLISLIGLLIIVAAFFQARSAIARNILCDWASIMSGDIYYVCEEGGNVGIGTTIPAQRLHLADGNFFVVGGGETAIILKRIFTTEDGPSGISVNPIFQIGRIIEAGDGDPELRFLYSDDNTTERAVFELDRKGIVASVKQDRGSHFEGFISGTDPEPIFRLNSWPNMRLEMGAGGNNPVDVAVQREATNTLTFLTGQIERLRIDENGNVGIGATSPNERLVVAGNVHISGTIASSASITTSGSVTATTFVGDGSRLTGIDTSDNLGDHVATKSIQLNGNFLSHDGDKEGVFINADGNVGIGSDEPNSRLEIDNGYLELDTVSGSPPPDECDAEDEHGRMIVDASKPMLYICVAGGWGATPIMIPQLRMPIIRK